MAAAEAFGSQPRHPLAGAREIAAPLALADQPHPQAREGVRRAREPGVGVDPELDLAGVEPLPHLPRHLALLGVAFERAVRPAPDADGAAIDPALLVGDLA